MYTVKNPTPKTKAIRVAGGHVIIKSKDKADIKSQLKDDDLVRYRSAGLIITETKTQKQSDQSNQGQKRSNG